MAFADFGGHVGRRYSVRDSREATCGRRRRAGSVVALAKKTKYELPSSGRGFGQRNGVNAPLPSSKCPCGSKLQFKECCEPVLSKGGCSSSAEQVMRARFTSYVVGNFDFIMSTTHPENEDYRGESAKSRAEWKKSLANYFAKWQYTRLTIVSHDGTAEQPEVQFKAFYRKRGKASGNTLCHWESSTFTPPHDASGTFLYREGRVMGEVV